MKRSRVLGTVALAVCLMAASVCFFPETAQAREITSEKQVRKLAKKQVKGAKIVKLEQDEERGELVYDVELRKGKKEYDLEYRVSDSRLLSYKWEIKSRYVKKGRGKLISTDKAKRLAEKQAKGAELTAISQKRSKGVDIYKVKLIDESRKYEIKLHARTGKVLEYEWDMVARSAGDKDRDGKDKDKPGKDKDGKDNTGETNYIGIERAKEIALETVGAGRVVKAEFDMDDGVPVYEIEIVAGAWEHELEIHAVTGSVLKNEVELDD